MVDIEHKIQNVVIRATYRDTEFDLGILSGVLREARYDPSVFPGIAYSPPDSEASFLIFSTGKVNCVGAKSVEGAREAIRDLTDEIRESGVEALPEPEVEVENIVASLDFGREFDVERIARSFRNVQYEPDVFPGLVFKLDDPKATVLLFPEGKGVCVGVKSEEDVGRAAERVTEVVE
ncbi:hypothetical protein AKJ57_03405 [candidate division MSBL1 archaeon SCGC-AAA259A05]|uniref:TATA-box-binding protein n=1 Tax=candidate division MSBL1 archaeon SCGC-AAA259A05 TaxID=1698259 RepID=A0A133U9M4_9EURY|nr:hypothetical protein AKJ57_03405 [candidate division MSBL1 archaeon SCGC-AAA259A05]